MRLRPFPVLYACAGCSEYGYAAPRIARALDALGVAEAIWLGTPPSKLTHRYPILTLDACHKDCARHWVESRGGSVQRALALEPGERDDAETATARIAAELSAGRR